ncbi:unnamed protein product (macronuclear) [Paramecium tetraurelia]|uniref:Protein kinase domain-containing protein n=1 Tax=Paramecium tetraurelia TaxID=5888 RepID=A0E448_PARTE|nr:uncharacterized protein GSPATT00023238001 [Paramecium tetraurelia]CAK90065.1 unnamed protein product [Paramecium tetraurelia]|eukprot:XP_001457462.1 hypothetical protein (macronuclear) [Paramecium tetraurelia strain d4-2]
MLENMLSPKNIQSQSKQSPKKIINDFEYRLEDCLGQGEYSSVFKGQDRRSGQEVAIKVIENSRLNSNFSRQMLNNEIESLKKLKSPYILQYINYIYTPNNQYIITEYCNEGELRFVKNRSDQQLLRIFHQLLQALKELKSKNIIHRDIKPPNIMMHDCIPKLADFGFSANINYLELQKSSFGTPLYMAPESLLNDMYSFQSDVWSVGITMHELIYGNVPFYHDKESELKKILQNYVNNPMLIMPKSIFIPLLKGMLDPNPNTRLTVEQLLSMITTDQNTQNISQSGFNFLSNFAQTLQHFESKVDDTCLRWAILKILSTKFKMNANAQYLINQQINSLIQQFPQ